MVQDDGNSSSIPSSPLQFFSSIMSLSPGIPSPYSCLSELKSEERGLYLIKLLFSCANFVSSSDLHHANLCLEQISFLASPDGDPLQRVAAYFSEALAARSLRSFPGIYRALLHSNSDPSASLSDSLAARRLFFDLCPFFKLVFLLSNHAILDAMEGEKVIHIIDLNCAEPLQWIALLQAVAARRDGPPHLRITGVHDHKEVLDQTAARLTEEAEKLDIPFQFNQIVSDLADLNPDLFRVKTGEALAICSVFQLHTLLAVADHEKARDLAKMEILLSSLRKLSPKIMVVAEQESNHNGANLIDRLVEALHYYACLFDCLDSSLPRGSVERMKVERKLFGEEIKNIISCEGLERKDRHERMEKWASRLERAGFGRVGLGYYGVLQARRLLLGCGCEGYGIKEEGGWFTICWQDRALYTVSAWRCSWCKIVAFPTGQLINLGPCLIEGDWLVASSHLYVRCIKSMTNSR